MLNSTPLCANILFAILFAGVQPAPLVEEVISSYQSYEKMTPEPVSIDPNLLAACVRLDPDLVQGPHVGSRMSIFMNRNAAAAFTASTPYPVGATIVKEKQPTAGDPIRLGGMIKRTAGFDSQNGDWEYFVVTADQIVRNGRLSECSDCHMRAQSSDFVFGDWDTAVR